MWSFRISVSIKLNTKDQEFLYFMRNVSTFYLWGEQAQKWIKNMQSEQKKISLDTLNNFTDLRFVPTYTEKGFFHLCGDLLQETSPSPLFFLIGANLVCFGSERHIAPFVQTTGTQHKILFDMINVFGRKKLMHDMIIFGMDYHFVVLSSNKKW